MSSKEAAKVTNTQASTRKQRSASRFGSTHHTYKSEATFITTDVPSPVDGTDAAPVTMTALGEHLYALIHHGPYQRRILGCTVLGVAAVLMEMLAYRIIARPVNHWCRPPEDLAHLTADTWKNLSIPVEADGSYSQCTVYVMTSTDSPENLPKERCNSWDYDIKDWGDSIVSRFDLVCDHKFLFAVASLLPALGYAVLAPVAGFAADRLGRKPVTMISGCTLLIATVGCSVSVNYAFFLVNRIVLVTCGVFSYLTTFVLLYEVTGNAQRWLFTLLHMSVSVTVVPPFLHLLSAQEPSWTLAHIIFIVPTAVFATWCSQLEESPVWLLATWRVKDAQRVILAAARLNHVDEDKAREGLHALCAELRKMQHSYDTYASPTSPSDAIFEAMKMRRHAVAAFFSRFACGGLFFGLMITDKLSGLYWQVVHVVLSMACYTLIMWAMNNYGPRDTLQGLLAATCVSAVARATSAYVGFDAAAACVRASMMILASGSVSVVMCYLGDIFPAKNRCTGVGLSIVIGGTGSIVGITLASVSTVRPGFVFDVFYAVMMLLSIFAVEWLPEVIIEKSRDPDAMSPDERKVAMQASLTQKRNLRRQLRESKIDVGQKPLS